MVEQRLAARTHPRIVVSDERDRLLETGGGVKKALPHLGDGPFIAMNADTLWIDGVRSNIRRLAEGFDAGGMDALLLLAPVAGSIGYYGRGDFYLDPLGRLTRRPEREVAPFVYAGACVLAPGLFEGTPDGPFSLNLVFDDAAARGRLFGLRLDGLWMHVGTPEAVADAEASIALSAA